MAEQPTLLNAFSVNMLDCGDWLHAKVTFHELTSEMAADALAYGFVSAVGHPATAQVLTERLGLDVPRNRVNVTLCPGDMAILAQVKLPRLAEGEVLTSEQMVEAPIRYFMVKIEEQ